MAKYKCKICDKRFTKFILLEGHVALNIKCKKQAPFIQCYICGEKFRHFAVLKYHLQRHSAKNVCQPKIYSNNVTVDIKNKNGQNTSSITCNICEKSFRHIAQHNQHQLNLHSKIRSDKQNEGQLSIESQAKEASPSHPQQEQKVACKKCGLICDINGIDDHMERVHSNCDKNEIFKTKLANVSLIRYEKVTHVEKATQKCKLCNLEISIGNFSRHMITHRSGNVKCGICNIYFTISSLRRHIKRIHPNLISKRETQCRICKMMCSKPTNLAIHMKVHTNGNRKCKVCKINFTRGSLRRHEELCHPHLHIQKNPPPFQCSICNMPFNFKHGLVRHEKVHIIGHRECHVCKIKFTKTSLVRHNQLYHPKIETSTTNEVIEKGEVINEKEEKTLEKLKLDCDICKKRFRSKKKLGLHIKDHDGQYRCDLCDIPYTKLGLEYHVLVVHRNLDKRRIFKAIQRNISAVSSQLEESSITNGIQQKVEDAYRKLSSAKKCTFQCVICKLDCQGSSRLSDHLKIHIVGKYKCKICNIWFTKSSLIFHQKREHFKDYKKRLSKKMKKGNVEDKSGSCADTQMELSFECTACNVTCDSQIGLDEHMKDHDGDGKLNSEVCDIPLTKTVLNEQNAMFDSTSSEKKLILSALERNIPRKPSERGKSQTTNGISQELEEAYQKLLSVKSKPFQCRICKLECGSQKKLNTHLNVHIVGEYKCDICNIWFTQTSFIFHQKRKHFMAYKENISKKMIKGNVEDKSGSCADTQMELSFECTACNVTCDSQIGLDEHMKDHDGDGKLNSEVCDIPLTKTVLNEQNAMFDSTSSEKKLILSALERNIPRKPSERGKSQTTNGISQELEEAYQKLISVKSKPSQCRICKLECGSQRKLNIHFEVHIVGEYKCYICNIWFTKTSFVFHQKREHFMAFKENIAKKMIKGNVEDKSGSCADTQMELSFECTACNVTCDSQIGLDEHMKDHDGDGKLNSEVCDIPLTKTVLNEQNAMFDSTSSEKKLILSALERNIPRKPSQRGKSQTTNGISQELEEAYQKLLSVKCKPTQCRICKLKCGSKKKLNTHFEVHIVGDYKCYICNIWFTKKSLRMHEQRCHTKAFKERMKAIMRDQSESFPCTVCYVTCDSQCKLDVHMNVHVGEYECEVCHMLFTKAALDLHTARMHPMLLTKKLILKALQRNMSTESCQVEHNQNTNGIPNLLEAAYEKLISVKHGRFQCLICKIRFRGQKELVTHINAHIVGEHKCDICNIWFTKSLLEFHQKRWHKEIQKDIKLPRTVGQSLNELRRATYQCKVCKVYCRNYGRLVVHKALHKATFQGQKFVHQERPTDVSFFSRCHLCQAVNYSRKREKQHMMTHDSNIKCQICQIPFTKRALLIHQVRYHPEIRYKERILKALDRHADRKMMALTTFQSVDAGKSKNFNGSVDETGAIGKSTHCVLCEKVCKNAKELHEHMRVHVQGSYKCEICQVWFTLLTLESHFKRMHPNLPKIDASDTDKGRIILKCSKCDITCSTKQKLNLHEKVHCGKLMCPICKIPFTKASLNFHCKKFHPELPQKDKVPKKDSLNCPKCCKSYTKISYLKLHMKSHRYGVDSVPLSDSDDYFSENTDILLTKRNCSFVKSQITLDNRQITGDTTQNFLDIHQTTVDNGPNSCDNIGLLQNPANSHFYECYVCKNKFSKLKDLKKHLKRHSVHQQWVDPLNVYLSNWCPEKSREILQNQPLVLVENLDRNSIDLKSLFYYDRRNQQFIQNLRERDLDLFKCEDSEDVELLPVPICEEPPFNRSIDVKDNEGSVRNEDYCQININQISMLENVDLKQINDNCEERMEYNDSCQINNSAVNKMEEVGPILIADFDCVDISSGSDDDVELMEDVNECYCYFCNSKFYSLHALGDHTKVCRFKCVLS